MSKRRRTNGPIARPRPIDKSLRSVLLAGQDATQTNSEVEDITFPCTLTGLRWKLSFVQLGGTGVCQYHWVIAILREGVVPDLITPANGSKMFEPEQNVMAFGGGMIDNHNVVNMDMGSTKTMRKMQTGDKLMFHSVGIATNTVTILGTIQVFCMT